MVQLYLINTLDDGDGDISPDDAMRRLASDWEKDSGGKETMDEAAWVIGWLECADQHASGTNPEAYVRWMRETINQMTIRAKTKAKAQRKAAQKKRAALAALRSRGDGSDSDLSSGSSDPGASDRCGGPWHVHAYAWAP